MERKRHSSITAEGKGHMIIYRARGLYIYIYFSYAIHVLVEMYSMYVDLDL